MVEYFQDEDGAWRYRIKGRNHEIMATSEAYVIKANAERGYGDLVEEIHRSIHDESASKESSREDGPVEGPFSKHDEVPGDNPSALRKDGD